MSDTEVKVVAAPRRLKKVRGAKSTEDAVAQMMQDAIAEEAKGGWRFAGLSTVTMVKKRFLLKPKEHEATVMVFERARGAAPVQAADPAPAPKAAPAPVVDEDDAPKTAPITASRDD